MDFSLGTGSEKTFRTSEVLRSTEKSIISANKVIF